MDFPVRAWGHWPWRCLRKDLAWHLVHDLVDMVVLAQRLDLMISEVFSNLIGSVNNF